MKTKEDIARANALKTSEVLDILFEKYDINRLIDAFPFASFSWGDWGGAPVIRRYIPEGGCYSYYIPGGKSGVPNGWIGTGSKSNSNDQLFAIHKPGESRLNSRYSNPFNHGIGYFYSYYVEIDY